MPNKANSADAKTARLFSNVTSKAMEIRSQDTVIEILDEPVYSPRSTDNVRQYSSEVDLAEGGYRPSSRHGVIINGEPVVVFLAGGGCSGVHDHSALMLDGFLYLAVGNHVLASTLVPGG